MATAMTATTYSGFYTALRSHLEVAVEHYERSAPVVSRWADDLYIRLDENGDSIIMSEIAFAYRLHEDEGWMDANYAANQLYHLLHRLGRDTTGLAGF